MSSEKKSKIPEAPVVTAGTGNILSSVAPPSELPNFITASPVKISPVLPINPQHVPPPPKPITLKDNPEVEKPQQTINLTESDQQNPEKFSPVIPLSKGEPTQSIRSPEDSQATQSPDEPSTSEVDKIGDIRPGTGILTWVKGAVSTGGILHQVVEKAKSSVDSMITTLDPQMKELYLNSGGDIYIVVASDNEAKISAVRQAFQTVFGKATVVGCAAQSEVTAAQPVGYAAAYAAAKQRIAHVRANHVDVHNNIPVLAIESFIQEAIADRWYELSVLVLCQPSLGVELHAQAQGAALPAGAAQAARARTSARYEHAQTGYSVTVGDIMAETLQVDRSAWHEATCGVSRREALALAARALAGAYARVRARSAGEL